MVRPFVLLAALAAAVSLVPAHAAPDLPVKLVREPGWCSAPYYEIGWVGVDGARWRICTRNPAVDPPR